MGSASAYGVGGVAPPHPRDRAEPRGWPPTPAHGVVHAGAGADVARHPRHRAPRRSTAVSTQPTLRDGLREGVRRRAVRAPAARGAVAADAVDARARTPCTSRSPSTSAPAGSSRSARSTTSPRAPPAPRSSARTSRSALPETTGLTIDRGGAVSVTAPAGLPRRRRRAPVSSRPARRDVALVVNDGPSTSAAAVFTAQPVQGQPGAVERAGRSRTARRARSCSTPAAPTATPAPTGFQNTHATAEQVAERARRSAPIDVVGLLHRADRRCSTTGTRCSPASTAARAALTRDGGPAAADAIMTTDTVAKQAVVAGDGWYASAAWPRAPACSRRRSPRCSSSSPPTPTSTPATADRALRAATRADVRPARLRRLHVHQRHGRC